MYPDTLNKKRLATAIVAKSVAYGGLMYYLGNVWYKGRERVPFHYYNDNAGYLQIDKFGHAYGAYLESEICYYWLRRSGVKRNKALIYGASMGFILQTPIEIFDGIYPGWGFSWGDMWANAAGPAFFIAQEVLFDKQVVDFKFSFTRSPYSAESNGMLGDTYLQSLFYDYNGHTYWLSSNLRNVIPSPKIPKWLNVALGYSANGMYGEFENRSSWGGVALPEVDRYRQFLFSLDIDWTQIETDIIFLQKLFEVLNHVKIPFPALEYNSLGEWRLHAFYF